MTQNPDAPAIVPVPDQAGWKAAKKEAVLPSGLGLKYLDLGDLSGEPLLFLHGLGDSSRSWSRAVAPLAAGRRLILPDLWGHGDSGKPSAPMRTPAEMAEDVFWLCRHRLGVARAGLAGHSLGGFVAQALAINHPDLAGKTALLATGLVQFRDVFQSFYALASQFGQIPDEDFLSDWCSNVRPVDSEFMGFVVEEARSVPGWAWKAACKGMIACDLSRLMAEFKAPALIIWGTRDPVFSFKDFEALKEAIPSAKALVYEGNGHNVHWEDPERAGRDLLEFFGA